MANYRYNATDARGKWVSGEAQGEAPDSVEAGLRARGFVVESLVKLEEEQLRRASARDVLELVEQLAGLARSGLPLPSGLRAAAAEVESPGLRSTFEGLAREVEAGAPLDQAIASRADRFPEHLRGLVLAASRSGRLADVLGEYVRNANLGLELRRKFRAVVAYPVVATSIVAVLVVCICKLSVRATEAMISGLSEFGIGTISPQTRFLILAARLVSDHWFEALAGSIGLGLLTWWAIRSGLSPARRRRLAYGVPALGPALRFTAMTEFCRLLALLVEAETPLPEALELAGRAVHDADVAESSDRMARAISGGQPLSVAFLTWEGMPAGLAQLFRWSEGHRGLPDSLRMAGDMFEARARSQSGYAASVLNSVLALLILWLVGFALAMLYLPMISLFQIIGKLAG